MKTTIKIEKEVNVKTLIVSARVRYWEDACIDGIDDVDGDLIPCRENDCWCPEIDIDKGIITNWKQGVSANIHFKVCDGGDYLLKDDTENVVIRRESVYVPSILSPKENGYGDYIIMDIDENGQIQEYNSNISDLLEEED